MHLRVFLLAVAFVLGVTTLAPLSADSAAASIHGKIEKKKRQVQSKKQRERVLASDVGRWTRRIGQLQGSISELQARQVRLETDLADKRRQLATTQARLRKERLRLARLRSRLAEARKALSVRMVELYKADEPDMVTVVLEADGFADLLERGDFMKRVSDQDRRIIAGATAAKKEATRSAKRLSTLQARQTGLTNLVARRRDEVSSVKGRLVARRSNYQEARGRKASLLVSTRRSRQDLEHDLKELEAESARVQARLARMASGPAPAGPIRSGSSGMVWPTNGSLTSPFGPRWGRLHAGIDIAAPVGTPIRAALSGKVVLLGWTGGYGNYTCVQHSGSLSTCYAHQSRYGTSNGASVKKGQVIGFVGNTGNSTGAHLHFETRINGTPVNPAGYL